MVEKLTDAVKCALSNENTFKVAFYVEIPIFEFLLENHIRQHEGNFYQDFYDLELKIN
jgi:hypothetical protein